MLKRFKKRIPRRTEIILFAWKVMEVQVNLQVKQRLSRVGRDVSQPAHPCVSMGTVCVCPEPQPLLLSALLGLTPDPRAICFGDASQALVSLLELDPGILSELSGK